jgi:hypothetical protein
MVIVKATKSSEAGVLASKGLPTAMGKYNEELIKAGVMVAGEGAAPEFEGSARQVRGRETDCDRRATR